MRKENAKTARAPSRWDVFVSHASEDKDAIARPLAKELRSRGLRVWYDEFELKIGDSLSENR
jgi:histidyl-tRNA synthetase